MFDFSTYPYTSRRHLTYASRGLAATSQHLAAGAGADILKIGGNAVDAAVATAIALTVTEPQNNGCGSDAFAIIHTKEGLFGLNSSGRSPLSISLKALTDKGLKEMPEYGLIPVTVPGCVAGWSMLSKRFGRLPFKKLFEPAIKFATEGYAINIRQANIFAGWAKNLLNKFGNENEYKGWFETFAPGGSTPKAGEIFYMPGYAKTLELIAESEGNEFYRGELAEKIDAFFKKFGGYLRKEDLEGHSSDFVEPVSVNYRGYDVYELPPNGQGIVALMALNMLKFFESSGRFDVLTVHRQIEAIKIAFSDGKKYITDPSHMTVSITGLLSEDFARERFKCIRSHASEPLPGTLPKGGTVYLCTADSEDNMVSYIQSNYMGFGSGIVIPGTGISLQNRGNSFSLDSSHTNRLEPGKRPYHTIIPAFLMKNKKPVGPFGVMGGFMQPQGHMQVAMNYIDNGLNPQASLDAPRFRWEKSFEVSIEKGFDDYIIQGLMERGHKISVVSEGSTFGSGQMIVKTDHGTLCGGTEPRCEGAVIGW